MPDERIRSAADVFYREHLSGATVTDSDDETTVPKRRFVRCLYLHLRNHPLFNKPDATQRHFEHIKNETRLVFMKAVAVHSICENAADTFHGTITDLGWAIRDSNTGIAVTHAEFTRHLYQTLVDTYVFRNTEVLSNVLGLPPGVLGDALA
jgi:hypothetical protein